MPVLVDTNVLLRSLHPQHPHYAVAVKAVSTLRRDNETLHVAAQNLIEFWAVVTRPSDENGLGMTLAAATNEIKTLRRLFRLLPTSPEILEIWQQLVTRYGVSGKQTHDAHLVAAMHVHSVPDILTFNVSHFERFPGIKILDPHKV